MKSDYLFIIPVYNDWDSLYLLQQRVEKIISLEKTISFLLVNDSSEQTYNTEYFKSLKSVTYILELSRNMGHQKAIATGLAYAYHHTLAEAFIVMDSDGEDRPDDLQILLDLSEQFKGIVFAKRSKRSEGLIFLMFYRIYKILFFILTGKSISFGNFCVIPKIYLRKIVNVPDIWNHFSGGIIRSGIPYTSISTPRGKRYFGESKMNFTSLVLHGLSAIAVYADFMAIRLIILSAILITLTIIGIIIVAFIRMFTLLAIPGWATVTILSMSIILFLSLLLGLFLLFNVLAMKTQKNIIPAKDYKDYIFDIYKSNENG